MAESKPRNTTLKKLARWAPTSTPSSNGRAASIPPLSSDAPFVHIHHDKLQQGCLYIIKIKQVSLAMFEGWNDDMCCFSVLRSETEALRWSEARQLPGDFDIYDAFDECGNPPIHLWSKYLKVSVPINWFSMFEEAKRKQREWTMRQQQQQQFRQSLIQEQQNNEYYYSAPSAEDGSVVMMNNNMASVYSNTDISTMSLNHHPEALVSPSIMASTNIIDPSLMNEDINSTASLNHPPSMVSTSNNSVVTNSRKNVRPLSPAPTYNIHGDIIQQQYQQSILAERSSSLMDREQIRQHLAPGQAFTSNRNSTSSVTLTSAATSPPPPSTPSPLSRQSTASPTTLSEKNKNEESSTKVVHHRSKEFVNSINQEEPAQQKENIKLEPNISAAYSNELDFPHDSDRFSIQSDIVSNQATSSPNMKSSASSKSRNRLSMKKIIWG